MEDLEKNINEILEIMKNNYNQYYSRTQNLDNKSGFLIAFHAAIIMFIIDFIDVKEILQLQYHQIGKLLNASTQIILYFFIFILAIISICLFIFVLKSRNIKYLPASISNEKYFKCKNIDLKKELLKGYREISENNEEILAKKHKIYNIASILTIVEIILVSVSIFIKNFV